MGLYDYKARFYHPALGRFVSADTIVPDPANPQALNRYAYVYNNPLWYTDPSGHWVETAVDIISLGMTLNDIRREGFTFWNTVSLATDIASLVLPGVPAGVSHVIRAAKWANAINVTRVAAETATHTDEVLDAVSVARRLREVGLHADEAGDLIKAIARQSTHGSGDTVVLGPWKFKDIEGYYIKMAEEKGAVYFATDPEVWQALGKDPELIWAVNEQFLRNQLEAGVSRIEFVGETVEEIEKYSVGTFRWRELQFLRKYAPQYGYELIENAWVKIR